MRSSSHPAERQNAPLVLLVDDDPRIGIGLSRELEQQGFRFRIAQNLRRARAALSASRPAAVLLDLCLPDGSGMELLAEIKERHSDTAVILFTGLGTVEAAVEAMKAGADDFVLKSFPERIVRTVQNILEKRRPKHDVGRMKKPEDPEPDRIIFQCESMRKILRRTLRVSPYEVNVLIGGESGTGKELLARLVHENSRRAKGPFMPIDCAALPESLFESELFGHEQGAFTGAECRHLGRLERAQGGTVFLDEIGNLSVRTQVKLLRVLQERSLERLGGNGPIPLDIRLVIATNVDLEDAIRQGLFRPDLYYRLNEVALHLPPLRERREDIPLLVKTFLAQFAAEFGKPCPVLSESVRRALKSYPWPGNIRELKSTIKTAILLSEDSLILPEHLPPAIGRHVVSSKHLIGSRL